MGSCQTLGFMSWRSVVLDRSYLGTRNKRAVMEIENWSKYISGKWWRKIKVKRFIRLYAQKSASSCVFTLSLCGLCCPDEELYLCFLVFFCCCFFTVVVPHVCTSSPKTCVGASAWLPAATSALSSARPARYPSGTPSLCPLVSATLSASCVRRPQGRREGSEAVVGTGT